MMLSKMVRARVRVRVRVRMRVINQSYKSAGNKRGVYAVLGHLEVKAIEAGSIYVRAGLAGLRQWIFWSR